MASNFPTSLDAFTNPSSTDAMDSVSVPHATQHSDLNDAVEALEAKVGADSSAVTSSHDYKIAQLEALGTATAFTPSWNNFTVGNAVESWYYSQINDLVIVHGVTQLGSTSAVTGGVTMDYPIGTPIVTGSISAGHAFYEDADGTNMLGLILLSASSASLREYNVSGSLITFGTVNATSPFTWTTDDEFRVSFIYQIA